MPRKHRKKIETKCDIIVGAHNQQSKQQAINNIQAMTSTTESVDVAEYHRVLAALRLSEQAREEAEKRARLAEESPEKAMMLKKIQELRDEENANGKEIYYENQEATATELVASIRLVGIVFQMVVAPCQSGKTGCMLATIDMLLQSDSNVNPDNIFVITGLSDVEWVSQTKKRLPFIGNNVIHRSQFTKSATLLKNLKNAVIIIDECQIACKKDLSLDKLLEKTGLKDLAYLKENNVNIVEFSATPNSTLNDIELWDSCSKMHVMTPGRGYKGHEQLLVNNRLYQCKDLFIENDPVAGLPCDDEDTRNDTIKSAIDTIKDIKGKIEMCYTSSRFHIIRTPTGTKADTVIGRFKTICGDDYAYKKCYGGEEQLMDELEKTPDKHTFLFIKEKARCAVTFVRKDLIGVLYERLPAKPKDDTIVQGLAGRACGYNVDDGIIVFTNVASIERYVTMMNSGFEDRDEFTFTGHKSKKETHIHPATYRNAEGEANLPEEVDDIILKTLDTFEDVKNYCKSLPKQHFGGRGRGPRKPSDTKVDEMGFVKSTIRGNTKVYTLAEVETQKKAGIYTDGRFNIRVNTCYRDINDISTLVYAVTHRDVE